MNPKRGTAAWYNQKAQKIDECVHDAQEISGEIGNVNAMIKVLERNYLNETLSDLFWFASATIEISYNKKGFIKKIKVQ